MLVKVCGLKYESNLEQVLKLKPDFVGFNFFPFSPRFVNEETLTALKNLNFENIKKVGLFVNESPKSVIIVAEQNHLDYVQLHGDESTEDVMEVKTHFPVIKAIGIETKEDMESAAQYDSLCDYILLDKKSPGYGGSGVPFDWALLKYYNAGTPFLLGGGVSPENIDAARNIKHPKFAGIDVNSGFEDLLGVKNIEKLKTILSK